MKKSLFSMTMIAGALLMGACNNNGNTAENDTIAIEEAADTVKYLGYPHGQEMPVEFYIVGDQLVKAMAGENEMPILEHKESMVLFGNADTATVTDSLNQIYKHVKCINTNVIDRMNHGEKNVAWIFLFSNEECQGCCHEQ